MIACKALITSQLHYHKTRIRFCSVCQSGFEPSLSGFVPAPTVANARGLRTFAALRIRVLFFLGKLDLSIA